MRKGKGKGFDHKGKDGKGTSDFSAPALSPFAPLAPGPAPWPSPETTTTVSSSSALMPSIQSAQDVAAMAEALKEAYPDEKVRPQNVKDMIEKAEREAVKDVTKGLHSATNSLRKAQKTLAENTEAKQQHRAQWAKHVSEAIQTWQGQLREYKRQQTVFQEINIKAKNDIELARNTIQLLNAKAAGTGLVDTPLVPKVETEDSTEADKEEEKLKQTMQNVLKSCAQSLGIDLDAPKIPVEVQEIPSEDEAPANKRPRSMEPFGGGAGSAMQS